MPELTEVEQLLTAINVIERLELTTTIGHPKGDESKFIGAIVWAWGTSTYPATIGDTAVEAYIKLAEHVARAAIR